MADFVDITPKGVQKDGRGYQGVQGVVFQDTEWDQINNNPMGLTKEGIDEKITIWNNSINPYCKIKYLTMKKQCRNVKPSGKTEKGDIILAINKLGEPTWVKIVKVIKKDKEDK